MICSGLPSIHRQARILVLQRQAQQLVQPGVHRDRDDLPARRHDLARVDFLEIQQLVDGLFLEAFQMARVTAGFHNELQLFGRVPSAVLAAQAEQARQSTGGALDDEHEGRRDAPENQQRRRHQQRQFVGFFERQILRHHLADHHVDEADRQERHRETQPVQPGNERGAAARSTAANHESRI